MVEYEKNEKLIKMKIEEKDIDKKINLLNFKEKIKYFKELLNIRDYGEKEKKEV